jgi:hypothetical protein
LRSPRRLRLAGCCAALSTSGLGWCRSGHARQTPGAVCRLARSACGPGR